MKKWWTAAERWVTITYHLVGNMAYLVADHMYNIYPQDDPSIDAYTHLLNWLNFYEALIGRPLQPDDHLFPTIGSSGLIHPERPMSPDIAQKQITTMLNEAGIHGATTHCFHWGGAQYRFMFTPIGKRWTLARIRWWGGWAQGEHVGLFLAFLLQVGADLKALHISLVRHID